MSKALIKFKCTECGQEQWIKPQDCECHDICTCSSPRCSECKGLLVRKRDYRLEIIERATGFLAQLIEFDDDMDMIDTARNRDVNKVKKELDKLWEMEVSDNG